ncbi:MAG: 30S ribosomal protein S11, small subunit ribosomal protein S11 [Microgenomates group bacterium GW2011_GWC1_41_20]|uniref:Small ribosomal subunit protein uS11 n=7 Tax=Candidatus Woeseibacteriota TaxID=1752722 RepID=A0A0G0V105_9BACT|nr:MAG: Ribosomal protein S11 [Candidatus Woesebacteria bacterium GW2011_GWB1_40_12]KKR56227.1 MAG: Ribosomal protein S11 [Candidatus Woesebacteria bacterium GW2011_GWF1_40_24]KKR90733.1 MAG: Ribosomal protein S11 [Candidatus Woesebacteria bacterium GW2011_GWD1_41_12]KKS00794.1 MAG: 30S ribosomal protein S11, small subunit ribosomal protein S11 [Microgenomates group bacterium GW2011_GWC1_41_20]KKS05767.1 MAG: Ribosomal protein S11 [Candidatus Woesebacteria bacterium GW2011_GWE1_41_24]KKS18131.
MATKNKKINKEVGLGRVYISASFNNTLVTVTNTQGETLAWGSSGASGFKGTRRATPFAATSAVEKVINKVKNENGVDELEVYVKGPGAGRDAALRAIKATGVKISMIADITPVPHNGPRPKKKRRV